MIESINVVETPFIFIINIGSLIGSIIALVVLYHIIYKPIIDPSFNHLTSYNANPNINQPAKLAIDSQRNSGFLKPSEIIEPVSGSVTITYIPSCIN
jgi:hypothetical protein